MHPLEFTDSNFTPKQKRNYKILRFMFNWAGWLVIACVVLPFSYELLAIVALPFFKQRINIII